MIDELEGHKVSSALEVGPSLISASQMTLLLVLKRMMILMAVLPVWIQHAQCTCWVLGLTRQNNDKQP